MITVLNIIWAIISTMTFPTFVSDKGLRFSNSIMPVLMAVGVYLALKACSKLAWDRRRWILSHILGLLFSTMTAYGYALERTGHIRFITLLIPILLYTHVFASLITLLWQWLMKKEDEESKVFFIDRYIDSCPWLLPIGLLLAWSPALLSEFPGGFRYDASNELIQVINGYNGNFPLLHSFIVVRLLMASKNLTGSVNAGITIYVVVQMLLMALCYSSILLTLRKRGVRHQVLLLVGLYTAFFPMIGLLLTQEVRDVLFASLMTYLLFLLYLMATGGKNFWKSLRRPIELAAVLILTISARNNNSGPLMIVGMVILVGIILIRNIKHSRRGVAAFAVVSIAGYLLLNAALLAACQPYMAPEKSESLSMVSQSLARTYLRHYKKWSPEELAEFNLFMDVSRMQYVGENADLSKVSMHNDANGEKMMAYWLRLGLRYPKDYAEAYLSNNAELWFPASIVDGYNNSFDTGYKKCYYDLSPELNEPAVRAHFWKGLEAYYRKMCLDISFEKIPLVSMLFSIGFQFWILIHTFFYLLYRKEKKLLLPVTILLLLTLGTSFVPLILVRYVSPLFIAMPLLLLFTFDARKCGQEV